MRGCSNSTQGDGFLLCGEHTESGSQALTPEQLAAAHTGGRDGGHSSASTSTRSASARQARGTQVPSPAPAPAPAAAEPATAPATELCLTMSRVLHRVVQPRGHLGKLVVRLQPLTPCAALPNGACDCHRTRPALACGGNGETLQAYTHKRGKRGKWGLTCLLFRIPNS